MIKEWERVMAGWRRSLIVLIAGAVAYALSEAAIAAVNGNAPSIVEDERAAVARAEELIDAWSGGPEELPAARAQLDAVLTKNPASAEAYFQYARYYIDLAMVNSEHYDPPRLRWLSSRSIMRSSCLRRMSRLSCFAAAYTGCRSDPQMPRQRCNMRMR